MVGAARGALVSYVWRMVRGFLLRVLRALCVCCFVSPVLDSNPAWLLGPTANRFAHIVWVGFDSSAVRRGPRSCLLGLPPPLLWLAVRGLPSYVCLGRVRVVVAPRGRMPLWGCSGISRLSTVGPLPVLLRAGRECAIPLFGDGVVSVRGGAGA